MADSDNSSIHSPTVTRVIEKFVAAMRSDDGIEAEAIDCLEKLLKQEAVPKPDEIGAALFDPSPEGDT